MTENVEPVIVQLFQASPSTTSAESADDADVRPERSAIKRTASSPSLSSVAAIEPVSKLRRLLTEPRIPRAIERRERKPADDTVETNVPKAATTEDSITPPRPPPACAIIKFRRQRTADELGEGDEIIRDFCKKLSENLKCQDYPEILGIICTIDHWMSYTPRPTPAEETVEASAPKAATSEDTITPPRPLSPPAVCNCRHTKEERAEIIEDYCKIVKDQLNRQEYSISRRIMHRIGVLLHFK